MSELTPAELAAHFYATSKEIAAALRTALDAAPSPATERDERIVESFARAVAWMVSLSKLAAPGDTQALHAGVRTLLEIATDLVLLHDDKTQKLAKMLELYERSQKLVSANYLATYVQRRGWASIDFDRERLSFAERNEATNRTDRIALWGSDKKPERWTGRGSLLDDARAGDQTACSCWTRTIHADYADGGRLSLEAAYAYRVPALNWLTHGSGGAALRGLTSGVHGPNALAYRDASVLGTACLRVFACEHPALKADETIRLLVTAA